MWIYETLTESFHFIVKHTLQWLQASLHIFACIYKSLKRTINTSSKIFILKKCAKKKVSLWSNFQNWNFYCKACKYHISRLVSYWIGTPIYCKNQLSWAVMSPTWPLKTNFCPYIHIQISNVTQIPDAKHNFFINKSKANFYPENKFCHPHKNSDHFLINCY